MPHLAASVLGVGLLRPTSLSATKFMESGYYTAAPAYFPQLHAVSRPRSLPVAAKQHLLLVDSGMLTSVLSVHASSVLSHQYAYINTTLIKRASHLPNRCGVRSGPSIPRQVRYLNKILHGYLKYGLPIWITEFACADDAAYMNEASQAAYLADALTLLELHPSVARYAW